MDLHSYFRSSASYRVRIGLNLKGLQYQYHPVNLLKGEQKAAPYRKLNPQGLVPALIDNGHVLTQSLAILEWLDEQHPSPPLLPKDALARAQIRALTYNVACDIQPVQNLRILKYLQSELGASDEQKAEWGRHWIDCGLQALETQLQVLTSTLAGGEGTLAGGKSTFVRGDSPGLFECCLIPQVYNAKRFNLDIEHYPQISRITEACAALPAFENARPENQPDCPL